MGSENVSTPQERYVAAEAVAAAMEREAARYEQILSDRFGKPVTLA